MPWGTLFNLSGALFAGLSELSSSMMPYPLTTLNPYPQGALFAGLQTFILRGLFSLASPNSHPLRRGLFAGISKLSSFGGPYSLASPNSQNLGPCSLASPNSHPLWCPICWTLNCHPQGGPIRWPPNFHPQGSLFASLSKFSSSEEGPYLLASPTSHPQGGPFRRPLKLSFWPLQTLIPRGPYSLRSLQTLIIWGPIRWPLQTFILWGALFAGLCKLSYSECPIRCPLQTLILWGPYSLASPNSHPLAALFSVLSNSHPLEGPICCPL
jgi:hypothetical protein